MSQPSISAHPPASDSILVSSLLSFLSLCSSSLRDLSARRLAAARLYSAESIGPLCDFIFAYHGLTRPQYSQFPSSSVLSLLPSEDLLTTLGRLIDGHSDTLRAVWLSVESLAIARPELAAALQGRESDLALMRTAVSRSGPTDESTRKVLAFINRSNGLNYSLIGRLDGGFSVGAHLIKSQPTNADGSASGPPEKAVLKWISKKESATRMAKIGAAVRQAISQRGYPSPEWIASGETPSGFPYHVVRFIEGRHPSRLSEPLMLALIAALEKQRGIDPDIDKDWTVSHIQTVRAASEQLESIRSFGPSVDQLFDRFSQSLDSSIDLPPARDLVHGDLHDWNMLVCGPDSDRSHPPTVFLIDCERMGRGSVMSDVASLLVTAARLARSDSDWTAFDVLADWAATIREYAHLDLALSAISINYLSYWPQKCQNREDAQRHIDLIKHVWERVDEAKLRRSTQAVEKLS